MLKTPFTVVLTNSVKQIIDPQSQKVTETIIPDPEGLLKAVAQARVLHPQKLTGNDLRFIRSALGMKAKELASSIAVTPEHMSRLESGDKVLSPQSEMLVRIFTFISTLPFTPKKEADGQKIAGLVGKVFEKLSVMPVRSADDRLTLYFERVCKEHSGDCQDDHQDGQWDQPEVQPIAA